MVLCHWYVRCPQIYLRSLKKSQTWNFKTNQIRLPIIGDMCSKFDVDFFTYENGHASRRHQMETFSALLALCVGNSLVTGSPLKKGQWCGALMFYLICAWINGTANNREAGDLRRHRAHYDITVMNSRCKRTNGQGETNIKLTHLLHLRLNPEHFTFYPTVLLIAM